MCCLIKYNKEIIFLYWKSHINNYIIKTLKIIDDLENLVQKNISNIISHKDFLNNCKIKLQLFKNIKEDYLCNKNIKSRRKYILIHNYNSIITIIENQDKIYRLNTCCSCNKHNK
tara:strand:- start:1868 stop:2212 length:345 start_codon:yes stop_codon:yes gene_type:complete